MAEISVLGATPKVIDALKKASMLPGRDMSYGDEGQDISFQEEPVQEEIISGDVYVQAGAALPAVITTTNQGLPYNCTVYPSGFGNNAGRYNAGYLLPITLAYFGTPATNTKIVAFTSYLPAIGGNES